MIEEREREKLSMKRSFPFPRLFFSLWVSSSTHRIAVATERSGKFLKDIPVQVLTNIALLHTKISVHLSLTGVLFHG